MRASHVNQAASLAMGMVACAVGTATANADTPAFDIYSTFNFIQRQGPNDGGFLDGISDLFGINVSPPFNTQPPLSPEGTSVTASQDGQQFSVPYFYSPANPYEFVTALPYPIYSLTGPWTFTLTNPAINGGQPVTASTTEPLARLPLPTQPLVTTIPPQFVRNVLLFPNNTTPTAPTLQWTWPTGYTPNSQSIFIYDKSLQTPNGLAPLVYANNNIGLGTTWTATSNGTPSGTPIFGTTNLPTTHNYIISIQLDQTNPSLPSELEGRSRTYVNFNISAVTTPVYVPTIAADGEYQFDISVETGQIYPIDPTIATGFNYAIGAGNPNFGTVLLPTLQGSDPYTITWDNGQHTEKVLGGDLFSFLSTDPLGVSAFTVTGIDVAAGVDPSSGTDFVTNLTFVGDGTFTGAMTPITASIPEPSTWGLTLLGFAGLGLAGYRRRSTGKGRLSVAV
jgi:hypothetical protein